MALYDAVADLPLVVDGIDIYRRERETSSEFTRVTTEFSLRGPDVNSGSTRNGDRPAVGRGEDVTYDADEHDALAETGLPIEELTGSFTVDSFSERVGDLDLFPAGSPEREDFRNYRRWAVESAALDLALQRAETDLAAALKRSLDPVRFVVSTRLGDPPTTDRIDSIRDQAADAEFKLDPTEGWDDSLVEVLSRREGVRILDLKGTYEGTEVDLPADPDLYRLVVEGLPNAVIEDPALTPETEPLFETPSIRERISWDAPIHGLEDVRGLPWEPDWLNVKPSRFGSIESLFETIEYCFEREIRLYGGGQFELGVGRGQLQLLASLFYPDGPNDVAPRAYNDPSVRDDLSSSPLRPPADPVGFRWE